MHPPSQAALPQQLSHTKGKGAVVPSTTREHHTVTTKCLDAVLPILEEWAVEPLPWLILIGGRPKEDPFVPTTWRSESRSV